jgi:hypothetical protein
VTLSLEGPCAVTINGVLNLIALGSDGFLWVNKYAGSASWRGWSRVGQRGPGYSYPACAGWQSGSNEHLSLFDEDALGLLYVNNRDNGTWSGWSVLSDFDGTSGAGAVSRTEGRIDLFVKGSDDAYWMNSLTP